MPKGVPKAKPSRDGGYYYETLLRCDLLHTAPAKREDQKSRDGFGRTVTPMIAHPIRVQPSRGFNGRGELFPPDYIVTERPLARSYTEVIQKKVSRPDPANPLDKRLRKMVAKSTKIKFRLLEDWEITGEVRRSAWRKDLVPMMFDDTSADVYLPGEPVPAEAAV